MIKVINHFFLPKKSGENFTQKFGLFYLDRPHFTCRYMHTR